MADTEVPSPSRAVHQREDVDDATKTVAAEVTEVQGDLHFHETVTAAPLDPWSRTSLQLYSILLVAALNATASGFDGVSAPDQHLFWHLGSWPGFVVDIQLDQCHEAI